MLKKFVGGPTHEIKCTKFFYVYGILCMCAFCLSILDAYCSIICSFLSELDDACHTNEMLVHHKGSQSIVCVSWNDPRIGG